MDTTDRVIPNVRGLAELASTAPWVGEVLGANLRQVREEHRPRLTQREAARLFAASGLRWTASTVATVEARGRKARREVPLGDLTLLAHCLDVPMARFFAGEGLVRVSEDAVTTLAELRALLNGESPADAATLLTGVDAAELAVDAAFSAPIGAATDSDHIAARELGVPVARVVESARGLWSRGLAEERDRRLGGDVQSLPKESLRARRGQVTRELIRELRETFDRAKTDRPKTTKGRKRA